MEENYTLGRKQVHVLIIGGNNLREASYRQRPHSREQQKAIETEVNNLLGLFFDVANYAQSTPHCLLLVSSLIPSPATQSEMELAFIDLHMRLRLILRQFPNCLFCNFTQQF